MDEDIRRRFEEIEKRVGILEGKDTSPKQKSPTKPQSIQEFLAEKHVDGYTKKTVAVGYYLEKYRAKSYFSGKDIEAIFREAREPVSKNISADIKRAIQNGWIMEHSEKEKGRATYVTTTKGEKAVKSKFKEGNGDEA